MTVQGSDFIRADRGMPNAQVYVERRRCHLEPSKAAMLPGAGSLDLATNIALLARRAYEAVSSSQLETLGAIR